MIGTSKAWFCGQDGSVYELTGQGSSWFPQYGKNFTYTGEYVIVPENDTDWKVKFLTSGTFTATDALLIDVFAVGGGGGGGTSYSSHPWAFGGGSGYTKTEKSIYLEKNKSYEIVIGTGTDAGNVGGTTSGFNITANGGRGGKANGNMGSGGSGGSCVSGSASETTYRQGGTDGGNGSTDYSSFTGAGQGTTTKEFAETTGDLYASGGSAMNWSNKGYIVASSANTGDGGGAFAAHPNFPGEEIKYNGYSGILIIRNHRE